jgi:hypothetical protein
MVTFETDPRFPSGAWTGFFLQRQLPGRHPTDVALACHNGELTGTGADWVGSYTIQGHYDLATGQCDWIKHYHGKHQVAYWGVNDGHGIWGMWEIKLLGGLYLDRGGFHLWPEGSDVSEASDRTEQAVVELMRKEFGRGRSVLPLLLLILSAIISAAVFLSWGWRY